MAKLLKLLGAQAGSKAVEAVSVSVVGIGLDAGDGRVDRSNSGVGLHLDNVLALNELSIARNNNGSRSSAPGRGGNGEGKESEESSGTHFGGLLVVDVEDWVEKLKKMRLESAENI